MKIKIREAKRRDFGKVFELITELAHFEKLEPPSQSAKKRLLRDSFGKKRMNNILIAESGKVMVGYAFYFFTYSSFLARKTLYLEDIFVSQNFRAQGAGKLMFDELNRIAVKNKCGRIEWCVLDWNVNAIKFYDNLGAKPLKDWIYYRKELSKSPAAAEGI